MKRITILGTVVATVLVSTALAAATSASASSGFLTEPASTSTLEGSATGAMVIETNHGESACAGPSLSGTGTTTMPTMPLGMSEAECGAGFLSSNGCGPILHVGTETSKGNFQGTMDIGPAGCGPITLSNTFGCTTEIGPQSGIPATMVNTGEGSEGAISVSVQDANFTYTYEQSGACGGGTYENGVLTAGWHVSAKVAGEQLGLHAADDLSNGLHLSTLFEAERYPAGLGGIEDYFVFETETGELECHGTEFSGELPSAGVGATMTPSYSNGDCLVSGFKATPHVNGCKFIFAVQGAAGLDCPSGKALEFKSFLCDISIPEQFLGAATYKNIGSGASEKVQATYSGSSLQYSYSGWCGSGDAENATLYPTTALINAFNPYQ